MEVSVAEEPNAHDHFFRSAPLKESFSHPVTILVLSAMTTCNRRITMNMDTIIIMKIVRVPFQTPVKFRPIKPSVLPTLHSFFLFLVCTTTDHEHHHDHETCTQGKDDYRRAIMIELFVLFHYFSMTHTHTNGNRS